MPRCAGLLSQIVVLSLSATLFAEVRVSGLFSHHMVLQQGAKVPVWGAASEGEEVTVRFGDKKASAKTKSGKWIVWLENLKPGRPPRSLTISGENEIELEDVVVGEVWICSGQSNMQWEVQKSADASATIAGSLNEQIRLFSVPRLAATLPQSDVTGKWDLCTPLTVPTFSAVAYHFGRELQTRLNVPIGLINTSFGGTPAQAWTSREALAANEQLQHYVGTPADPKNKNGPAGLYNAMIHPLVPYGIRGAIWYQGEANAGRAHEYRTLFPAMIADWRKAWGQGDFPFLFVQLAPFMPIVSEPVEAKSTWAELREAQLLTMQEVPNSAMAVITDVGDEKNIHPKQKAPVGQRLALAARAIAYAEEDLVYSGPVFSESETKGNKVTLEFDHVGSGLMSKGGSLRGFAIAGKDGKFVAATAEIVTEKDKPASTIVVHSPEVSEPAAVRYGWANYPTGNLWNKDGLPASPFRTDDFPLITAKK